MPVRIGEPARAMQPVDRRLLDVEEIREIFLFRKGRPVI